MPFAIDAVTALSTFSRIDAAERFADNVRIGCYPDELQVQLYGGRSCRLRFANASELKDQSWKVWAGVAAAKARVLAAELRARLEANPKLARVHFFNRSDWSGHCSILYVDAIGGGDQGADFSFTVDDTSYTATYHCTAYTFAGRDEVIEVYTITDEDGGNVGVVERDVAHDHSERWAARVSEGSSYADPCLLDVVGQLVANWG